MRTRLAGALLGWALLFAAPIQAQDATMLQCEAEGASASRKLRVDYRAKEVSALLDDGTVKWTAPATFTDTQIRWIAMLRERISTVARDQIGILRLGNTQGERIEGAAGSLDRQSGRVSLQRFDRSSGWPDEFSGICRLTTQKF